MKPDLNKLLQLLLENKIDFVLIGGFAGVVHGSSLVTKDLDICSLLTPANIEKLRKVLAPLQPKHRMTPQKISFLDEPRSVESINNLYLETTLGTLDIISTVAGVGDFKRLSENATEIPLFGYECKIISIDDLISAKRAMGRDKDKIAVRELSAIRERKEQPKSISLESVRFNFSVITHSAAQDVFNTLNYKETAEMITFLTWPMTMQQAEQWCHKSEEGVRTQHEFLLIARSKLSGEPVGCICLLIANERQNGEIGFWVANPWQGKGVASEMIRAVVEFAFHSLGLQRIEAQVATHNIASEKAVKKNAFLHTGKSKKKTAKGTLLEMNVFELNAPK